MQQQQFSTRCIMVRWSRSTRFASSFNAKAQQAYRLFWTPPGDTFPDFSRCTNIYRLIIPRIMTNGSIPDYIANFTNLNLLWLRGNQLTGSIPSGLWYKQSLQTLALSTNQLQGSIPSDATLPNLSHLYGSLPSPLPFRAPLFVQVHTKDRVC